MYNEYLINKMVDSRMKKYATYYKRKGSNLDILEKYQRDLEEHCEDKIREKNYQYLRQCTEILDTFKLIENRFDYYFKVGNFYAWQNGNENFKKLLQ